MANNRFNWTRVQASTVPAPRTSSSIPSMRCLEPRSICHLEIDHTTNTGKGYFMQADLAKRQANDFARLKTPVLTTAQCMTFYYHVFGSSGLMSIYMAIGDNLGVPLWIRSGSQGDVWRFGRMSISKTNVNVVFEGTSLAWRIHTYLFRLF